MKLTPNYILGISKTILLMILVTGVAAYMNYLIKGEWWLLDYWVSLLIPLILLPITVCLLFVPQYIVVEKEGFIIKQFFRMPRYVSFQDVRAFRSTKGVFLIQPTAGSTLQIFAGFFSRKTWKLFVDLIENRCPGKKALFWFGTRVIR